MIRLYHFTPKGVALVRDPLVALTKQKNHFWLDLQGAKRPEIHAVAKTLKLHQLATHTLVTNNNRARLEIFPNYLLLVVHAIQLDRQRHHFVLPELDIILGRDFLITNHLLPLLPLEEFALRLKAGDYTNPSPANLLYQLLDLLLEHYYEPFERFDHRLESVEQSIFDNTDSSAITKINDLKCELRQLRRSLSPQKEALAALSRDATTTTESERLYLRNIHDRFLHITERIESFHEITMDFMNAYLSLMSNKMNEVMKILTIFATIIMPLTLVSGIYGMNFKYMPELEWSYGYYFSLGIMAVIAICLLVFFRRKNWL